ncbi:hypothetical protein MASR1M59_19890 [Melaminivora sp.]
MQLPTQCAVAVPLLIKAEHLEELSCATTNEYVTRFGSPCNCGNPDQGQTWHDPVGEWLQDRAITQIKGSGLHM